MTQQASKTPVRTFQVTFSVTIQHPFRVHGTREFEAIERAREQAEDWVRAQRLKQPWTGYGEPTPIDIEELFGRM